MSKVWIQIRLGVLLGLIWIQTAWESLKQAIKLATSRDKVMFFFLFDLILYVPVNNLSVTSGRVFLGLTSTKLGLICLAQGHNAVMPVRLKPAALRSRVKHSTTEPLPS